MINIDSTTGIVSNTSLSEDEEVLSWFKHKMEQMIIRYGDDTAMFNTRSLRLKTQIKIMEDIIAMRRGIDRVDKIYNLLEDK